MTAYSQSLLRHIRRLAPRPSSELASDAVLLDHFVRDKDQDAFAGLVARHGTMVFGVCRRVLHNIHEAEDAAQATFLVLARKAATIRHRQTLAAWLHQTAHHLALKCRRAEIRRRERETRNATAVRTSPQPDPLDELSARELLVILDEELRRLPERYRLPLILCHLEGRTHEEAARQLGWTAGSVKGRLRRGRAKLQRRLVKRGLTLSAVSVALMAVEGLPPAAGMPAGFLAATLRAAASDGEVSAKVIVLAKEGIRNMAATKAKSMAALLLVVGVTIGGAGSIAHQMLAAGQSDAKQVVEQAKAPSPAKEKTPVRTDRYGDPLPPGAIARLGTMRLRPGDKVFCLPGGKTFLSLAPEDEKMVVCVWRMTTGELLRRFEVPTPHASVALSADGKILATSHYDALRMVSRIQLWDVASGRMAAEVAGVGSLVHALAFAPDGKTLATAGGDQVLRLWEWRTATELRRCQGTADHWRDLVFSADGKVLASASFTRQSVQLWEAATGRALRTLGSGAGRMEAIAFAPDGKTLATAALKDKAIRLWEASTGKEVRQFPSEGRTETFAFSPDGKPLASGGMSEYRQISPIYLWDVNTGREVRRMEAHLHLVSSLAFSPTGEKLVSAGGHFTMHVWDVATGKDSLPFAEHESYVESIAYAPDGRSLATAGLEGTIRLWEPAADKPSRLFRDENQPSATHVAFAPDGRTLLSSQFDGSLRFWDMMTGRPTSRLRARAGRYSERFAYSPNGRTLAVWHEDGTLRLLDAATGEEKRQLSGGAKYGKAVRFSADGGKLATMARFGDDRTAVLQLWDTATWAESRKWTVGNSRGYFPIVSSPDGQSVIGGISDPSVAIGETKRFFLHLWNVATGEERTVVAPPQATVLCMAASPDGHMLAWGDMSGTITLWELAANQLRRRLKGQYSYILSLDFSPDGKTLASGSADTTVLLWDVTGRPAGRSDRQSAEQLWADLANKDATKAFDAIGLLTAAREQAVAMLRDKLKPAPPPTDRMQVARRIAKLDNERFEIRQKAMEELKQLGERAEPVLREALKDKLPLEARKRIEELLEGVRVLSATPERLRDLRAVEVLEHIGTPDAQQLLQSVANGAPSARLTREAKASLQRIAKLRSVSDASAKRR
jgi:RNA polymerase sigma factor (sigma-70 family)